MKKLKIKEDYEFMSGAPDVTPAVVGGEWIDTEYFSYTITKVGSIPVLAFHREDKNYLMLYQKSTRFGIRYKIHDDGFIYCRLEDGLSMLMDILTKRFWG